MSRQYRDHFENELLRAEQEQQSSAYRMQEGLPEDDQQQLDDVYEGPTAAEQAAFVQDMRNAYPWDQSQEEGSDEPQEIDSDIPF
jgi:hypothetical protein